MRGKELLEELGSIVSGKTLDALLPPLAFVMTNGLLGLRMAAVSAIVFSLGLGLIRLHRRQNWKYAFGGLLGVVLASGLAFVTNNAANFFLTAAITSALLFLAALTSLLVGQPLAAWASHLTRGWPVDWFWRDDIKPAYREVTWLWAVFLIMRLAIQVVLLRGENTALLAIANTLLGWPITIAILTMSYVYGIWRLKTLGGPGVDEYKEGKLPPWKGQMRGF